MKGIQPDERYSQARDTVDETALERYFRVNAFLNPQTQPVKAPGRRPADKRAKNGLIEKATYSAKPRAIVVPGQEAHAVLVGDVFPITRAFLNERFGVV